jgi:RNA polymerase sigma-70 factor, ECF subfamily
MDSPSPDRVDLFMMMLVRHQGRLYQYVRMLMPRGQDVEDVLQQTLLVMWKKFDESYPEASFYSWATRIAYLEVLKSRDRQGRDVPVLDREILELIADEEFREPDFLGNLKTLLEKCLDLLAPVDRELIERRYESGMMVNNLAAELGRPVNSVSKSLGRIRRTLLKCINEKSMSDFPKSNTPIMRHL